jgi:hypothetical protein
MTSKRPKPGLLKYDVPILKANLAVKQARQRNAKSNPDEEDEQLTREVLDIMLPRESLSRTGKR